uniref:Putative secreted protein n=1 Tax=Ixodes ricinus TaxID=34613 RepID=A0A6B0TYS2_IXORI
MIMIVLNIWIPGIRSAHNVAVLWRTTSCPSVARNPIIRTLSIVHNTKQVGNFSHKSIHPVVRVRFVFERASFIDRASSANH